VSRVRAERAWAKREWVDYSLHREIPVLIHQCLVANREKRDLPCPYWSRGRVSRKQLDVEGVDLICYLLATAIID